MTQELSQEQARAQAWEMLLAKAREAQDADPNAVAAAKTLLEDPAWKETIEASITAPVIPETVETAIASESEDLSEFDFSAVEELTDEQYVALIESESGDLGNLHLVYADDGDEVELGSVELLTAAVHEVSLE